MEWYGILAVILAAPLILFPVAYLWYLNVGGTYHLIKEARKRRAGREYEEKVTEAITPKTVAAPRIREVQVLRRAGEEVTGVKEKEKADANKQVK